MANLSSVNLEELFCPTGIASVEGYGKDVDEERKSCIAHRQDIILKAREDMEQMINASDEDTSLQQLSEKLAQYETFPEDVQKIRRKLQRKYQNAVRDTERKIRSAMASRNPQEVDELIKSFDEQKGFVGEAYLELEKALSQPSAMLNANALKQQNMGGPGGDQKDWATVLVGTR